MKVVGQESVRTGGEGGGGPWGVAAGAQKPAVGDPGDVAPDEGQQPGGLDPNLIQHNKSRRA
jgi:hypothetical protein